MTAPSACKASYHSSSAGEGFHSSIHHEIMPTANMNACYCTFGLLTCNCTVQEACPQDKHVPSARSRPHTPHSACRVCHTRCCVASAAVPPAVVAAALAGRLHLRHLRSPLQSPAGVHRICTQTISVGMCAPVTCTCKMHLLANMQVWQSIHEAWSFCNAMIQSDEQVGDKTTNEDGREGLRRLHQPPAPATALELHASTTSCSAIGPPPIMHQSL